MSVQNQVLERAEGSVAFSGIRGFTRAAHVENQSGIWHILGNVDHPLQLVHRLNASYAFHFGDGKGRPTLTRGAQVAARGRVKRGEREAVLRESAGHRLYVLLRGVIEVASCGENFDSFEACLGNLPKKFRGQPSRNEHISR